MAISQYGNEYYGLSGDDKPLGTPLNGRKFTEMDTSKEYRYDAENQQWLQQSGGGGGGGSTTLAGLTDVDISNPTDGQTLVYNATSGKWENGAGGSGLVVLQGSGVQDPEGVQLTLTYAELYALMQTGPVFVICHNFDGIDTTIASLAQAVITEGMYTLDFAMGASLLEGSGQASDTVLFSYME